MHAPQPDVTATKWAIVNKPKHVRALGRLTKFKPNYLEAGSFSFEGQVYDQENETEANFTNDMLPCYIKNVLAIDTPLVLTWVKMEEPCGKFEFKYSRGSIMFPEWAIHRYVVGLSFL
jgi:hypothetical protein